VSLWLSNLHLLPCFTSPRYCTRKAASYSGLCPAKNCCLSVTSYMLHSSTRASSTMPLFVWTRESQSRQDLVRYVMGYELMTRSSNMLIERRVIISSLNLIHKSTHPNWSSHILKLSLHFTSLHSYSYHLLKSIATLIAKRYTGVSSMRVQQVILLGGLSAVFAAPIAEPEPAPADFTNYGGKCQIQTLLFFMSTWPLTD
jgi:hypothetical protein